MPVLLASSGHATTRSSSRSFSAGRRVAPDDVGSPPNQRWCSAAGSDASPLLALHRNISMTSGCPEQGGLTRRRRAATCVRTRWGVSDPRRSGLRDRLRGVAEGVAHAPHHPHLSSARLPRRRRSPPSSSARDVSNGLFFNDLSRHAVGGAVRGVRVHRCRPLGGQGEHCSRVCVPPLPHVQPNRRR